MSPRLKTALAIGGSFLLGGGLLMLALRGVDFTAVGAALRQANYAWLVPLVVLTFIAHGLRAWRWQLLLETLGPDPQAPSVYPVVSYRVAFFSLMIGYMVNYAAPRLGEVARAANVAAQTPLHFAGVLGTVVVERVLDVLSLAVALATVFFLFQGRLTAISVLFLDHARLALDGLLSLSIWVVVVVVVFVIAAALLIWRVLIRSGGGFVRSALRSFGDGIASLLRLQRRWAVLFSTVGIWLAYGLMAYVPLQLLGMTDRYELGVIDAWALMNVGAIGMSLPSPGGTGSFHYVTVQAFVLLFGVPESPAATYALLTHAAQLVLFLFGGFACLVLQGTSLKALRRSNLHATQEASPTSPVA